MSASFVRYGWLWCCLANLVAYTVVVLFIGHPFPVATNTDIDPLREGVSMIGMELLVAVLSVLLVWLFSHRKLGGSNHLIGYGLWTMGALVIPCFLSIPVALLIDDDHMFHMVHEILMYVMMVVVACTYQRTLINRADKERTDAASATG